MDIVLGNDDVQCFVKRIFLTVVDSLTVVTSLKKQLILLADNADPLYIRSRPFFKEVGAMDGFESALSTELVNFFAFTWGDWALQLVKTTHERCGPFSLVVLSQRRGRVYHVKWLPSKNAK